MQLENELRLSYYQELGEIDGAHGVKLVQHIGNKKVFVQKTLGLYDLRVYQYLQSHQMQGLPHIEELIEDDGRLYVIEEYISGDQLRDLLDRNGRLPEKRAVELVEQLCRILQPLHRQKPPIVHRDIKPGNLIVSYRGEVTLIDFNSAKETSAEESRDTVLIGTAGYAAPEQYGFSSSQPTADIYAIGVLLNELLTGKLPGEQLYQGRVRKVIETCTQMDPANRYKSVDHLLAALHGVGYVEEKLHSAGAVRKEKAGRRRFMKWLPPGYRSGNPGRMLGATLWYLMIVWVSITLTVDGLYGAALFIDRLTFFAGMLFWTLWLGNYRGIWDKLPWTRSKQPMVLLFGLVLWGMVIFLTIIVLGLMVVDFLD